MLRLFNYVSYIVDDMRDTVTDMRLQCRFGDLNGVRLRIERVVIQQHGGFHIVRHMLDVIFQHDDGNAYASYVAQLERSLRWGYWQTVRFGNVSRAANPLWEFLFEKVYAVHDGVVEACHQVLLLAFDHIVRLMFEVMQCVWRIT